MRPLVGLLALLLLLAALTLPAFAASAQEALEAQIDPEAGLSPEVQEEIGSYDGSVKGFLPRLLKLLSSTLGRIPELGLEEGLRTLGAILAAALLCALGEEGEQGGRLLRLTGALAITALCTRNLRTMIGLGSDTISQLRRYSGLLMPGMASLVAASGGLSAATSISGVGMVLMELLLTAVEQLLVPLVWIFTALSAAEAGLDLGNLEQLRRFVHWLLVSGVKLLMYGFGLVLSMTGLVSGALDAQRLRMLRSALAGMVPVVGGIVSEASASLLSAAGILRNAAGLYGMLAVLGICLGPFVRLGIHYLLLKLAGALCGLFGKGSQSPLLEHLSQAMGMILALTALACILNLMILVLCLRTVTP